MGGTKKLLWLVVLLVFGVLLWSGVAPKDRFTWFLEIVPILIGLPVLGFLVQRGYKPTPLLLILLGFHACILALGGKYTYAEVPFGFWMRDFFGFARNHYFGGFVVLPIVQRDL